MSGADRGNVVSHSPLLHSLVYISFSNVYVCRTDLDHWTESFFFTHSNNAMRHKKLFCIYRSERNGLKALRHIIFSLKYHSHRPTITSPRASPFSRRQLHSPSLYRPLPPVSIVADTLHVESAQQLVRRAGEVVARFSAPLLHSLPGPPAPPQPQPPGQTSQPFQKGH